MINKRESINRIFYNVNRKKKVEIEQEDEGINRIFYNVNACNRFLTLQV